MSESRICPLCHCPHEVDDDGTIATWCVTWSGDEHTKYLSDDRHQRLLQLRTKYPGHAKQHDLHENGTITNRSSSFIHREDAESEYRWIKNILIDRGDWEAQQQYLTLTDGERASWDELFVSGIANWQA
jgi:hypothetical protein